MKTITKELKPRFLQAEVEIATDKLYPMIREVIVHAQSEPFWIETLLFMKLATKTSQNNRPVTTYRLVDLRDRGEYFTSKVSDDQLKAAIIEHLAAFLVGAATEICKREYWQRYINVVRIDRNPPQDGVTKGLLAWINDPAKK